MWSGARVAARLSFRQIALTVLLVGACPLIGQESRPAPTLPDFSKLQTFQVARIEPSGVVMLRWGDRITSHRLHGVAWPAGGSAVPARKFLENLLVGEDVYLQEAEAPAAAAAVSASVETNGSMPREAVNLFRVPDGLFVNLELVRQGYARMDDDDDAITQRGLFRQYERRAKEARKGIWSPRAVKPDQPAASRPASPATPTNGAAAQPAGQEITVYVTLTGKRYHKESCRHLGESRSPLKLAVALEKGYTPCATCKPPSGR